MAVVIGLVMAAATGCTPGSPTPTASPASLWSEGFRESLCAVLIEAPLLAERYDAEFDRAVAAEDAERVNELHREVIDAFADLSERRPRSFEWPDASALIVSLEDRIRDWQGAFGAYRFVASYAREGTWNAEQAALALSRADEALVETARAYREETLAEYEALRAVFGFECDAL